LILVKNLITGKDTEGDTSVLAICLDSVSIPLNMQTLCDV